MRKSLSLLLFALLLLTVCASAFAAESKVVGIVATDSLELRPLELNQRDVVSVLDLVYEGLFTLDDNYQPQPELAYSYEFTNEGRRLRVVLRSDVVFHNGRTLTSADVIATLDAMYALSGFDKDLNSEVPLTERGLYYSTFYSIKSWEALDDTTLLFSLRRQSYGSLYALTFPILQRDQVNYVMPAGTGPYRYDGYEAGSAIWLTANTNWWRRTPKVTNIRANIYGNQEAVLTAFDQQDIDIALTRSINASRYSGSMNSFALTARTRQLEALLVNRSYTLFKSDDNGKNLIREAIGYAIDRGDLISSIYQGMATVAYTPVPSGLWFSNETTIADPYDPLMASALLDSAGYKMADDGKRYKGDKAFPTLRLLVYDEPGSTVRTNAAEQIKKQLAAVGIPVTVTTWTRENVATKLTSGDYALVLAAFNFDVSPDPGFTLSSTAACNYTRYRNDHMNDLIAGLRSSNSLTADGYASQMREIQSQFVTDQPYIALYWRTGYLLTREAFTDARDIRELEMLRGIESFSN